MGTVRVSVVPAVLEWAARRAGWNQEILLRRAPKFEEWVSGVSTPTLKQLERFSADTHAPFGMLFLAEPPVEEIPIPDMRTIRDEGVREPSADLLETIYLCQRRQDWYRDEILDSGARPLSVVGSVSLSTPVDEAAARIGDVLRFAERRVQGWSDAMADLIARVEALGILVMVNGVVGSDTHRKLNPNEFRGFALADDIAPLIFVNGADTKAAQIFTLIHELAHLWLGHSALSDAALDTRGSKDEERWCNQVAAEVLVPLGSLREEWKRNSDEGELERLARLYTVSTLVVLARMRDAGFLTWSDYMILYDGERKRAMDLMDSRKNQRRGGNYYNTQIRRLGRPFARAVISSALEGRTSYRDAYRLLGTVKHSTFEGLAEKVGVG